MGSIELPHWAVASDRRRAHIARVVALLEEWAAALQLPDAERTAWRDAGRWHDALRDAPERELRALVTDPDIPAPMLHGPAAAARLRAEGEQREDVLHAIAHHTTGSDRFARVGRALFVADFLEPGRPFDKAERARLAGQAPADFEGVFRQVVRMRVEAARREGRSLHPETERLWSSIQ